MHEVKPALLAPPHGPGRMRRVAVVANGAAGALIADPAAEASLAARFAAAGLLAAIVPAEQGSLPQRMAAACAMDVDAVVVAGGDGTVACAAAALLGRDLPLGILPFGTMNLLARDLGLPVGDTAAAIALLATATPRPIDVGTVGGEVFLCASMLGLPARLARHRERGRRGHPLVTWLRFAVATIRALLRGRHLHLGLQTEAARRRVTAQSVTVTVNPLSARSGRAFGRARLDGGVFGLYVIARLRLRDLPRLAWRAVMGRIEADPAVDESQAARLTVAAAGGRRLRVMNDGEVRLLRPPLRYRLRPGALRVLAPPQAER